MSSFFAFTSVRMGTLYAFFSYFSSLPYEILGPEWAVAYVALKFTGKLRQPVNIAFAAVLSKLFPFLTKIEAGPLLGILDRRKLGQSLGEETRKPSVLEKYMDGLVNTINQYGIAFYISSKITVLTVLCATVAALKYGVDVHSFLASWNVSDDLQNGASAMVTAVLANMVLIPLHAHAAVQAAPRISKFLKKINNDQTS